MHFLDKATPTNIGIILGLAVIILICWRCFAHMRVSGEEEFKADNPVENGDNFALVADLRRDALRAKLLEEGLKRPIKLAKQWYPIQAKEIPNTEQP